MAKLTTEEFIKRAREVHGDNSGDRMNLYEEYETAD